MHSLISCLQDGMCIPRRWQYSWLLFYSCRYSSVPVSVHSYRPVPSNFFQEPDIHPFLLARQAAASPVRESGQSAVYRSLDVPYGYPLRRGLNIKDETTSKWGPGKDGDLRDIWLTAAKAGAGKPGKILTLRGNSEPHASRFEELSKQINAIGTHLQRQGSKRIAIHLPNSTEFLVSLFGLCIDFLKANADVFFSLCFL